MYNAKIIPTIGRVMLYWPRASLRGVLPWCGLVVAVSHSPDLDGCVAASLGCIRVNLGGFTDSGNPIALQDVPVIQLQDGEPAPAEAYACWIPFQIGQAAKTDELTPLVHEIAKLLIGLTIGNAVPDDWVQSLAKRTGLILPQWYLDEVAAHGSKQSDLPQVLGSTESGETGVGSDAPASDGTRPDDGTTGKVPSEPNSPNAAADECSDSPGTGPAREGEVGV